jgi:hypothetical protein
MLQRSRYTLDFLSLFFEGTTPFGKAEKMNVVSPLKLIDQWQQISWKPDLSSHRYVRRDRFLQQHATSASLCLAGSEANA